jgi:transcriptional regulator with XRE-family HTH domain
MGRGKRKRTEVESAYYRAIGARIREVRLAKSVTLLALATAIGVSESDVCAIELHGRSLTVYKVVGIAKFLDVSVGTLIRHCAYIEVPKTASCIVQKSL